MKTPYLGLGLLFLSLSVVAQDVLVHPVMYSLSTSRIESVVSVLNNPEDAQSANKMLESLKVLSALRGGKTRTLDDVTKGYNPQAHINSLNLPPHSMIILDKKGKLFIGYGQVQVEQNGGPLAFIDPSTIEGKLKRNYEKVPMGYYETFIEQITEKSQSGTLRTGITNVTSVRDVVYLWDRKTNTVLGPKPENAQTYSASRGFKSLTEFGLAAELRFQYVAQAPRGPIASSIPGFRQIYALGVDGTLYHILETGADVARSKRGSFSATAMVIVNSDGKQLVQVQEMGIQGTGELFIKAGTQYFSLSAKERVYIASEIKAPIKMESRQGVNLFKGFNR